MIKDIKSVYYLAQAGYDVTIFEYEQEAGGVLKYDIPSFRFPQNVSEDEIETLRDMNVKIKTSCECGKDVTIESLKDAGFG
jgi:NADPH-dependent glutamate synthase beta subunit-like oxidoreductase